LNAALVERVAANAPERDAGDERATLEMVVADLQRELGLERDRRVRAEERRLALEQDLRESEKRRRDNERASAELAVELRAAEAASAALGTGEAADAAGIDLDGLRILYVGGKSNLLADMKIVTERCSAELEHHDGGVEANTAMLPALVGRAD